MTNTSPIRLLLWGLALSLVSGCIGADSAKTEPSRTGGQRIVDGSTLRPDRLPYQRAVLIQGGTTVPVTMVSSSEPGRVTFNLEAHDEVFEYETFTYDDNGFRLQSVKWQSYEPPIPLLRYPMVVGEEWTWGGQVMEGRKAIQARARIATSEEKLNTSGGQFDTVKISVNLMLRSGGPNEAERLLTFWFAPDKGLIKRDFSAYSTRVPGALPVLD